MKGWIAAIGVVFAVGCAPVVDGVGGESVRSLASEPAAEAASSPAWLGKTKCRDGGEPAASETSSAPAAKTSAATLTVKPAACTGGASMLGASALTASVP